MRLIDADILTNDTQANKEKICDTVHGRKQETKTATLNVTMKKRNKCITIIIIKVNFVSYGRRLEYENNKIARRHHDY